MSEDEAFIRAIVDNPGDDTSRLVYADWLDDRDDPRGSYLRAEHEWANNRKKPAEAKLRKLARPLDALWVACVSRPPLGVCVGETKLFVRAKKPTTEKAIAAVERKYGVRFPTDYRAFLLNYNGGGFLYPPMREGEEPDSTAFIDYFCGVNLGRNDTDMEYLAELMFEGGNNVNRGSEWFPIGGPDQERVMYLLGVRGKYFGKVYAAEEPSEPWTNDQWRSTVADSFAALLAELAARTSWT